MIRTCIDVRFHPLVLSTPLQHEYKHGGLLYIARAPLDTRNLNGLEVWVLHHWMDAEALSNSGE